MRHSATRFVQPRRILKIYSPIHSATLSTRTVKTPPMTRGLFIENRIIIEERLQRNPSMKQKLFLALMLLSVLVSACSAGSAAGTATPEAIPTVIADSTLLAEGR